MADNVIYVNFNEGVKRVMDNAKFYVRMLAKFKDNNCIHELEEAFTSGDLEKSQTAAHTLKGLAGNLSLTELYNQCLELETQIKAKSVNPDQITVVKDAHAKTLAEVDKVIAENA
ncbi:MAG: Hpt domain-containing protein [Treponema sp.]|nr:Hpt domain-containing protein [Treponema sp.]